MRHPRPPGFFATRAADADGRAGNPVLRRRCGATAELLGGGQAAAGLGRASHPLLKNSKRRGCPVANARKATTARSQAAAPGLRPGWRASVFSTNGSKVEPEKLRKKPLAPRAVVAKQRRSATGPPRHRRFYGGGSRRSGAGFCFPLVSTERGIPHAVGVRGNHHGSTASNNGSPKR